MSVFSTESFAKRWRDLGLMEQLGNIGSEVDRVIAWKKKDNIELATNAFYRALELLDLTIVDPRWRGAKRRELTRVREVLCDSYVGDNVYNTPLDFFSRYFYQFALAARIKKSKSEIDG
jgi:hypothetical protein